jgi:hypothetical protein
LIVIVPLSTSIRRVVGPAASVHELSVHEPEMRSRKDSSGGSVGVGNRDGVGEGGGEPVVTVGGVGETAACDGETELVAGLGDLSSRPSRTVGRILRDVDLAEDATQQALPLVWQVDPLRLIGVR